MISKQVMPMLRLSEMYLIAMEASNNLTEIETLYVPYCVALDIPANVTFASKDDVLAMIEREYRCDFMGEGQMFYYYKRNKAASMLWSDKVMTENDYIIPLPDTEFDPNLTN